MGLWSRRSWQIFLSNLYWLLLEWLGRPGELKAGSDLWLRNNYWASKYLKCFSVLFCREWQRRKASEKEAAPLSHPVLGKASPRPLQDHTCVCTVWQPLHQESQKIEHHQPNASNLGILSCDLFNVARGMSYGPALRRKKPWKNKKPKIWDYFISEYLIF